MNYKSSLYILFCLSLFLTGCSSFDTTNFAYESKYSKKELNLQKACVKVQGFNTQVLAPAGYSTGYAVANNGNVIAGNSVRYSAKNDSSIQEMVKQKLEETGFRCRGKSLPTIIIKGDLSNSIYTDWSHGWTDALINVSGMLTLFSWWSVRQKYDAYMRVYSIEGDFLKQYKSTLSYNSKTIGFLFSAPFNSDQNPFVIKSRLQCATSIDMINQFLDDVKTGYYYKYVSMK